jgi:hypothetical protein
MKIEVGNTRRVGSRVGTDRLHDRGALVGTETEADEVINGEEGQANRETYCGRFQSSIVRAATGDLAKSSNQFSRTVEGGAFKEEVGKVIKATHLEVGRGMDMQSSRGNDFDVICTTAEN